MKPQPADFFSLTARGWRLFPLHGKKPAITAWPQVATADRAQLDRWLLEFPGENFGVACGLGSKIFVVDIDGEVGALSFAKLEAIHGPLPPTYEVETARGRHLYFNQPPDIPTKNQASGELGPGVDVRGDGGYVVAPGSIHPETKRAYLIKHDISLADPPVWLLALVRRDKILEARRDARLVPPAITAGKRNSELTRRAGQLRWLGYNEFEILDMLRTINKERVKPPLEEPELKTIAMSIGAKDPARFSATGTAEEEDDVLVRSASDIIMKPITWRWYQRLPFGNLIGWAGDPGHGKSTLAYTLAALISRGRPMPFAEDDVEVFEPAPVVILSGEDNAEQVISPRLTVAGADLLKIKLLNPLTAKGKTLGLPEHLGPLRRFVGDLKPMLIIVDPLNAFVGSGVDSHKDAEMRHSVTQPLSSLAQESGAIVLVISHLNKSAASALYRVSGSVAMAAAPRGVFFFADDEEELGQHVFGCIKMNLSAKPSSLLYQLEQTMLPGIGPVSKIRWIRESKDHNAAAMLEGTTEERSEKSEVKKFLLERLKKGPVPTKDIEREIREAGLCSIPTYKRARADLKIKAIKREGGWWVALSSHKEQAELLKDEEI